MMPFDYSFGDTPMDDKNEDSPVPAGKYILKVTAAFSKDRQGGQLFTKEGHKKVTVYYSVAEGDMAGRRLKGSHTVAFSPAAEKMTRKYLKCIGEPCDGKVNIDVDKWKGKLVGANVTIEDGWNRIGWVYAVDSQPEPVTVVEKAEDIPF